MLILKIVSGGQTGVDRGALKAAVGWGFPCGGLIWKGRLCEVRAEVRGDAGRAEAIVQNRLHDDIIALNVVIDGKWEMRHSHAVMPEVDRVDSGEFRKIGERPVDVFHEMVENPGTAGSIEILCLDKVELSKCGKAHPSHLKVLPFGRRGGPSRLPSHRQESCRRRRVSRAAPVPARAMPAARSRWMAIQAMPRDNPSPGLSRSCSSRQLSASPLACACLLGCALYQKRDWMRNGRDRDGEGMGKELGGDRPCETVVQCPFGHYTE